MCQYHIMSPLLVHRLYTRSEKKMQIKIISHVETDPKLTNLFYFILIFSSTLFKQMLDEEKNRNVLKGVKDLVRCIFTFQRMYIRI